MDPLGELTFEWDTSLATLRELARRGHETWCADSRFVWQENQMVWARAQRLTFKKTSTPGLKRRDLKRTFPDSKNLRDFELILIRKEPPFDSDYLYLTQMLEALRGRVAMVNDPRGIRDANEKLSILNFPEWIPETLVTRSAAATLKFRKRIHADLVVKPLDQKGGEGVFILKNNSWTALKRLGALASRSSLFMAQRRLDHIPGSEKRILILNGNFLCAYAKHPAPGEFRANLGLGGTFHKTVLSHNEAKLVRALRRYLLDRGLFFVGIDVLAEKLIEINVTSPAGLYEARVLYPRLAAVEGYADFLQAFAKRRL